MANLVCSILIFRSLLKGKQLSVPTTWELPLARSVLEFLISKQFFYSDVNKARLNIKGFTPGLILKVRVFGTRNRLLCKCQ